MSIPRNTQENIPRRLPTGREMYRTFPFPYPAIRPFFQVLISFHRCCMKRTESSPEHVSTSVSFVSRKYIPQENTSNNKVRAAITLDVKTDRLG